MKKKSLLRILKKNYFLCRGYIILISVAHSLYYLISINSELVPCYLKRNKTEKSQSLIYPITLIVPKGIIPCANKYVCLLILQLKSSARIWKIMSLKLLQFTLLLNV